MSDNHDHTHGPIMGEITVQQDQYGVVQIYDVVPEDAEVTTIAIPVLRAMIDRANAMALMEASLTPLLRAMTNKVLQERADARFPEHICFGDSYSPNECVYTLPDGERCMKVVSTDVREAD